MRALIATLFLVFAFGCEDAFDDDPMVVGGGDNEEAVQECIDDYDDLLGYMDRSRCVKGIRELTGDYFCGYLSCSASGTDTRIRVNNAAMVNDPCLLLGEATSFYDWCALRTNPRED